MAQGSTGWDVLSLGLGIGASAIFDVHGVFPDVVLTRSDVDTKHHVAVALDGLHDLAAQADGRASVLLRFAGERLIGQRSRLPFDFGSSGFGRR